MPDSASVSSPASRSPYAAALANRGWAFLLIGLLARLPNSAAPLLLTLVVSSRTGSLTFACACVGALALAGAAGGPLIASACSRFGPIPIIVLASVTQAASLSGLDAVLRPDSPLWQGLLLSAAFGAANPGVGALSRSSWQRRLPDAVTPQVREATLALEAANDETSFVIGPLLTAPLLLLPRPGALIALAVAALVVQPIFAFVATIPRHRKTSHRSGRFSFPWRTLLLSVALAGSAGLVFGSTQTGIVAVLRSFGRADLSGLVYAGVGAASAVIGLVLPLLPSLPRWRVVASALVLTAGALVLFSAQSTGRLVVGCLLAGAAVAPILLTAYDRAHHGVAQAQLPTVMAIVGTSLTVGIAAGAAVAGRLADLDPHAPFGILALAVVVCGLAGLLGNWRTN